MATEQELKFTLDEAQYLKVRKWMSDTGATLTRTFSNHFFDSPELALKERGFGLRLRVHPHDQTLLTLKGPSRSDEAGVSIRDEWEEKVDAALAAECIHGRRSLESFGTTRPWRELEKRVEEKVRSRLRCLGGMNTLRIDARRDGFQLELDACSLFDQRFFELEMETAALDRARTWITRRFVELDIPLVPSRTTKLGRFFEEWARLNPA